VEKVRTMSELSNIPINEPVRLDPDRLGTLYFKLGESGADNVICRAMEELAVRLNDMPKMKREGDLPRLAKTARSLVGIADQIGMSSLARVAGDVAHCANNNDHAALGATLARLQRIGDRSLSAIWDMQDMSV
jgi:hypothetical protein